MRGQASFGNAPGPLRLPRGVVGADRDREVREVEELRPAVPRVDLREGVGAARGTRAAVSAPRSWRISASVSYGVGGAFALQLAVVHVEARVALRGELQHREALVVGRVGVARRDGREGPRAGRRTLLETEGLGELGREPQVPEVDRVEGAAEEADRGQVRPRTCPSPSTIHFCDVRPSSPTGPRACSLLVEMPISAPRPYS